MPRHRFKEWIYRIQIQLSKSRVWFWFMVKLRNQANITIGLHLSDGSNIEFNGEKLLAEFTAPFSKNFVDVGANQGDWTRIFASRMSPNGKGLCVEPGEKVREDLLKTVKTIHNMDIELLTFALSDHEYEAEFWEHENTVYSGMVRTDDYGLNRCRKVPVKRLLDVLRQRSWETVDFLKIDTEGYDFKVIRGCGEYVDHAKVRVIQFEYGSNWRTAGDTLTAAVDFLRSRGYLVFFVKKDGLHAFDSEFIGDFFLVH